MNRISKISTMVNSVDSKGILLITLCVVFSIGLNPILDFVLVLFCCFVSVFMKIEKLFYIFIFMSFFEDVTIINFLGGSISRVVMVLLLLKLILTTKFTNLSKRAVGIIAFFIISIIAGIFYQGFSFSEITLIINILVIVLFGEHIKHRKVEKRVIQNIEKIIVYSVLFSIIYGLLHFSYMHEVTGSLDSFRFMGTYEPNFMSLYINMGISILLFNEGMMFSKKEKYLLLLLFFTGLIMTKSMTGFICVSFIMFVFVLKHYGHTCLVFLNKYKKIVISSSIISLISLIVVFSCFLNIDNKNKEDVNNSKTYNRIEYILQSLKKGDINALTSGRVDLMQDFLKASFERSVPQMIIGNGPSPKLVYSKFFGKEKYVHNTYVDFLYNFGILGSIIVLAYILNVLRKRKFMEISVGNFDSISVLRFIILIYCLTLSLYTKRIVLLFFLI